MPDVDVEMPDRPLDDDNNNEEGSHDLSRGETEQEQKMDDDEDESNRDDDREGSSEEDDDDEEEEDLSEAPPPPPPRPKDPRSRKRRRRERMFQDCVTVQIPIDCSADLGLAMRRTRQKRIEAIAAAFPEIIAEQKAAAASSSEMADGPALDRIKGDTTMDDDDEENADGKAKSDQRKGGADAAAASRKPLPHVPRREDYANVVDYLEAKYAQGVMLEEDEDDNADTDGMSRSKGDGNADDDEGQGSVYSQSSFLDDRDLQRDVAEQVLANSTTTKIELQNNFDDAFFVNVGTLEVEESFLTEQGYDPVDDVDNVKKPKKRKRKPAEAKDKDTKKEAPKPKAVGKAVNGEAKKTKASAASTTAAKSPTKKKADAESPKKKPKAAAKAPATKKEKKPRAKMTQAEKTANAKKKEADAAYKIVIDLIMAMSAEDLPRRKTKERVAITCPPDKKAGDLILFANPHVPGQRLKVKIPKKTKPGATFRVTVPVASNPEDDEDTTDHNRWSRDFYDAFGDFCSLYDDWVDLMAVVKKDAGEKDFVVYSEKRQKFENISNDSPQDLKTPLDRNYMQKLLRRARQNRHKRERTLKRQEQRAKVLKPDGQEEDEDDDDDDDDDDNDEDDDEDDAKSAATDTKSATGSTTLAAAAKPKAPEKPKAPRARVKAEDDQPTSKTVLVPELSTEFPTIEFDAAKF